ncbi:MAG: hypothetical protein RL172_2232 [Bacteroidota bacterium]
MASAQQNNIAVLCTRPIPDALLRQAAAAGITVHTASFIDTIPVHDKQVHQQIANAFLQDALVVFTSMNAVEAVAAQLKGHQPNWRIYCLGNTTRQLVAHNFGEHCIAGTAPDASQLARLMLQKETSAKVLFFCGNQRRDELPQLLTHAGVQVNEVVVYQTIEVPHILQNYYDGILFFSPSAVRSFFTTNKLPSATVVFAIGNTTTAELKKYTNNTIITGNQAGKENLFNQVMQYFL